MNLSDLKDAYRRQLKSDDRRSERHTVVQLPCCRASLEITRTGDQIVTCPNPKCLKRSIITWGARPKIETQVPAERHGNFYVRKP